MNPRILKPGDQVALVAPSFSFDKQLFQAGLSFLKKEYGLNPVFNASIFKKHLYFAGNDQRRLHELLDYFLNPKIKAIFTIRGGYGCARIYSKIIKELKKKKPKPKIFLGYSDHTIFLNGLYQDLGWTTFHGPVLVGNAFHNPKSLEKKSLKQSLFTTKPLGKINIPRLKSLSQGKASAPLVGGCLSLLTSSIGTPFEIITKDKILFIEDVTEKPYRIDRMLTQLIQAGKLDSVKGIIFGEFEQCGSAQEIKLTLKDSLQPFLKKNPIPVLYGFPAGHARPQLTIPIGTKITVKTSPMESYVEFHESGVKS